MVSCQEIIFLFISLKANISWSQYFLCLSLSPLSLPPSTFPLSLCVYVYLCVCIQVPNKGENSYWGFLNYFCFMYTGILPEYMFVYHVCSWCPKKPEDGVGYPETGVL